MLNLIIYFVLCPIHVLLATNGIMPISAAVLLAITVPLSTYNYIKLDSSWIIQVLLVVIYIINGPGFENLVVLLCSILLCIYSTSSSKKQLKFQNIKTEITVQQHQFNETFQTVRKERHDYLKHIAAISYMLEKDNIDSAKSYMAEIIDRYEETNLSIKGEQGAVASILHSNYKAARDKGIAINYLLEVPISSIPIPSHELVELVGNIVENAIDACEEWQKENKEQGFIELNLRKRSGLYILTCKNSSLPLPHHVTDQLFKTSGLTTKEQHAGLGTMIIQQIVDNHHGFLDFISEKNNFSILCKIPSVLE